MNSNTRNFKDEIGLELIVLYRKSAIIFKINDTLEIKKKEKFDFIFDSKTFKELFEYLYEIVNKLWNDIKLKECTGFGSDYAEYYDKELDNNGYLSLSKNQLILERVSLNSNKLYQFNKLKMQSFLYDFRKILNED